MLFSQNPRAEAMRLKTGQNVLCAMSKPADEHITRGFIFRTKVQVKSRMSEKEENDPKR